MKIAVLADTHDSLPPAVCARFAGAGAIWHLGDVCAPSILDPLHRIAPVRVVRGNCDDAPDWPAVLDFTLGGIRFHLEHCPAAHPPACDIFLHGHTHVARDEMIRGVRFLNPGCISRPKRTPSSFGWLTVEDGRVTWEIEDI